MTHAPCSCPSLPHNLLTRSASLGDPPVSLGDLGERNDALDTLLNSAVTSAVTSTSRQFHSLPPIPEYEYYSGQGEILEQLSHASHSDLAFEWSMLCQDCTECWTGTGTEIIYFLFKNVSAVLNVNEVDFNEALSIYPNPSNGQFNIEIGVVSNAELKIYNLLGQEVYAQVLQLGQNNLELTLNSGVYLAAIKSSTQQITKKLVIRN